jgi:UDP-glucose 4-epimerase
MKKMKNILITGIGGFIGSQVAKAAMAAGHSVIGIDDFSQGYRHNIPKNCECLDLNLIHAENFNKIPKNIDIILHLAGQSSGEISFDNPALDLEKNTVSTLNLIQYGIQNGVEKLVYASSMSVYGAVPDQPIVEDSLCAPLSCYGAGKLVAEHYLKIYQAQLPYVALRMFNVYGPGQDLKNLRQGMVSIYLAQALKSGHIQVKGNLNRYRDFIYIDDVLSVWMKSIEDSRFINQILNLGTGVRTTVLQLLEQIQVLIPTVTWEEIKETPGDQFGIYADTRKLKETAGLSHFMPLKEGLSRFLSWSKDVL